MDNALGRPARLRARDRAARPNLAERLGAAGVETITVQPGNFLETNLTKVLFRGNRFEGIYTLSEWVDATVQPVAPANRLIVSYLPQIDIAAHVGGRDSGEYAEALGAIAASWEAVVRRLPDNAVAIATANHGHLDFPPHKQFRIARKDHEGRIFHGDGRAMFVKGEGASLAEKLPATWVPIDAMDHWWGPGPHHPQFEERMPDGVLIADDDALLLHRFSNSRLIGNHGALTDAERQIPLLEGGD